MILICHFEANEIIFNLMYNTCTSLNPNLKNPAFEFDTKKSSFGR